MGERLCAFCGCPRLVHHDGGECLHCAAFRAQVRCWEYLPDERDDVVLVNAWVIQEMFVFLWSGGLCLGIGLYAFILSHWWTGGFLVLLGVLLSGAVLSLLPSRPAS